MEDHRIIIITGLSGSGKSTAIKALEDVGFFCVDNLPVVLLPQFLALRAGKPSEISRLALVMDIREKGFLSNYAAMLDKLMKEGYQFEVIFLEASGDVLLRRYSQTRRHHPLADQTSLREGIAAERRQLEDLRRIAHKVIDTSQFNVHDLKSAVLGHALKAARTGQIEVHVMSFGFKYGLPFEADLVVDVRFLPNPFFEPSLRDLDGTAPEVEAYVNKWENTHTFIQKYLDLLDFLIPLYAREGKSYLTIAVGCTGGRHRSIVIAREFFERLKKKVARINLTHRDIELA